MENRDLKLYFREIIYYHPTIKKRSVCGVFSYEALNAEEMRMGNIYLVGKIANIASKKRKSFDFLLNLLASAIKRDFYANTQKSTIEAMESALQGANIYLADFTKRGHKEWIGNLDFACLAFSQNNIYLSQTGGPLIYLLRHNSFTNLNKKFIGQQKGGPEKTFTNIASGVIEQGDKLIVASKDILEIASPQIMKEILIKEDGEELYNFIKDKLENQSKIKIKKDEPSPKEPIDSLACLILEVETESNYKKKKPPKIVKDEVLGIDLQQLTNNYFSQAQKLLKTDLSPKPSPFIKFLSKYPIFNHLIAVFILCAIISTPYLVEKINYDIKFKNAEELINRVKTLTTQSKFALAYQDQSTARPLLQQANFLTLTIDPIWKTLPGPLQEKLSNELKAAKEELELQQNTLNNIVVLKNYQEIVDLTKSTYSFNPQGMFVFQDSIYLYEISSGFINKIPLENPVPTLIFVSAKDTFKFGIAGTNSFFLLSDPEKIYVYKEGTNYTTYLIKPDLSNTLDIKDAAFYDGSIYFLNVAKQTILKYQIGDEILEGSDWLKKSPDAQLNNAGALTVDGNVFVAKENGTILQYAQGKLLKDITPQIKPGIGPETKLFTRLNMKNLYILDPVNNRIIAINKENGFTTQYVARDFDLLKDFWVSEDEKNIFFLNDSKIFKAEIEIQN